MRNPVNGGPKLLSCKSPHDYALTRDLHLWMSSNWISLNPKKTQFIWLGTLQQFLKLDTERFPSFVCHASVQNLGVVMDSKLTFSQHVAKLTRSSYFQLRRLRSISLYLHCPCLHLLSIRLLQFSPDWSSKSSSFS